VGAEATTRFRTAAPPPLAPFSSSLALLRAEMDRKDSYDDQGEWLESLLSPKASYATLNAAMLMWPESPRQPSAPPSPPPQSLLSVCQARGSFSETPQKLSFRKYAPGSTF